MNFYSREARAPMDVLARLISVLWASLHESYDGEIARISLFLTLEISLSAHKIFPNEKKRSEKNLGYIFCLKISL